MSTAIAEEKETGTKLNQLEQLKKFTKVVADTADFESIKDFKPEDATTNPSLVYAATQKQQYSRLVDEVLANRKNSGLSGQAQIEDICDHLLVQFGSDILEIVPGRVSTETDARLSYDVEGSIKKARTLIKLYEEHKIPRERVLIKIASTWEGLLAAEQLQREGVRCNLTLLFSLPQAIRAAEAKVQLISPFVGRIYDWYKKENKRDYQGAEDPGVQSVTEIYNYYKKFGYKTQVMGASFRNLNQIVRLAGADLLTISPDLLDQLEQTEGIVTRELDPERAKASRSDRGHRHRAPVRRSACGGAAQAGVHLRAVHLVRMPVLRKPGADARPRVGVGLLALVSPATAVAPIAEKVVAERAPSWVELKAPIWVSVNSATTVSLPTFAPM